MIGVLFLLLIAATLFSMRLFKKLAPSWQTYIIKKGKHFSQKPDSIIRLPYSLSFSPKVLQFSVIFGAGCDYDTTFMGNDKRDINKLYGISYGFQSHWNSIRIGWLWNNHNIELYSYVYFRGNVHYKKITNVALGQTIDCKIHAKNGQGVIQIDTGDAVRECDLFKVDGLSWIRFKLFPYFGGNKSAPNNMKIYIKNTK